MKHDELDETKKTSLIKSNLKRAFDEKAAQDLPPELIDLIAKLSEQDAKPEK